MAGLYIHIPYCLSKCAYCDFFSEPYDDLSAELYHAALLRAMDTHPFGERRMETLYLGGGTPSLLGIRRLDSLLECASRRFGLSASAEITLEVNPDTVDENLLRDLRKSGYNRISFGVQSLREAELSALGRRHDARKAKNAILTAARCGFENISADLMLGIPGQTRRSLAESVAELSELPVRHVSAYILKIEPDTPFGKSPPKCPDEDESATLYLDCARLLELAGYSQYEISNFALDGAECVHNLNYWRCGEYLGVGPAAHSFFWGRRFFFERDLPGFIGAERPFELVKDDGEGGLPTERLMLGLRLREGYDTADLAGCGIDAEPLLRAARNLRTHGLCEIQDGVITLTAQGFLLSNPVTAAFLDAMDGIR